jgi:Ca2+-binding RTX toxin-like protein
MRIALGNESNSLNTSTLPVEDTGEAIGLDVTSEGGSDLIITAAGQDRIDPGSGSDEIHGARSSDYVETTSFPDGNDLYDLGEGDSDQVSYRGRADSVHLHGETAGAPGENDRLIGVEMVAGGSADDTLTSGPSYRLIGNGGDDRITGRPSFDQIAGGPGDDVIFGGDGIDYLTGDLGNDVIDGGGGNDDVKDHIDWLSNPGEESGGTDIGYGQGGNDWVELGGEADRSSGGEGNDRVYGDLGNDLLDGGAGSDHVLSSRTPQDPGYGGFPRPIDSARDVVNCGAERDFASVNPWDAVSACEHLKLVRAVELRKPRVDAITGNVVLPVAVTAPGRLILFGSQVERIDRIARRSSYSDQGSLPV